MVVSAQLDSAACPPHSMDENPKILFKPCPCTVALTLLAFLFLPRLAAGQENYEIQVYDSETVPAHHTELELHTNLTVEGTKDALDGLRPTHHSCHETIEITHGFNSWFETAFYIFTSARSGDGWD